MKARKARKAHRRQTRYVVRIAVHVPMARDAIDMMRYDSCFPASEEESRKLWALDDSKREPASHLVQFICVGQNENTPTRDRWRSFGCTVFEVFSPDEPLKSPAELLASWSTYHTRLAT